MDVEAIGCVEQRDADFDRGGPAIEVVSAPRP
jgi:hypothetical protein